MKILIADDCPTNQKFIESLLNEMGIVVETAENGEQAVMLAQQSDYDLILMKLTMPVMDGLEATRRIRNRSEVNKNTRIIAITANSSSEDREDCFAAGVNDFIPMPINISSFRLDLQRWLEEDQASESQTSNSRLVNLSVLRQLQKDTGEQVLPVILDLFIDECKDRLTALSDGHEKQNWKVLENEAHALKSTSGSFGAIKLQAYAREIELAAKNRDINSIDKIIPDLEETTHLSLKELSNLVRQDKHE